MVRRPCLYVTLMLALASAPPVLAQTNARHVVEVQAQDLGAALKLLAQQMKIQIVYSSELVEGKKAPALSGSLTPREALDHLLKSSGLKYEFLDGQTITLSPANYGGSKPSATIRSSQTLATPSEVPGERRFPETQESASASEKVAEMDTIVVTGSRLRRLGGEGASPITTLDAEAIERTGAATIRDVFKVIPQASVNPSEISGFMASAPIQLRGLSIGTTLVLVNGHRVAPSGANGRTVDVGAIPVSAVERIEIVTDGGSAIYGSDAIGGIVNILLKDRVDGAHVDIRYGSADDGKAAESQASLTWGINKESFRTTFAIDLLDRKPLLYSDRSPTKDMDFSRFGGTDFSVPYTNQGTVYSLDGNNLPGLNSGYAAIPQGVAGILHPSDFLASQGQVSRGSDYYANRQIQPETRRLGILSNTIVELTDSISANLELLASENRGEFVLVQPFITSAIPVPASNPYNPFGVAVGVNRLLTGMSPNVLDNKDRFYSAVAGLKGLFGDSWQWEASLFSSEDSQKTEEKNVLDFAAISAALNNPDPTKTLNLFAQGPIASVEVLAGLLPTSERRYDAKEYGVTAGANGNVFDMPAGAIQVSFGLESRRSELYQKSQFDNSSAHREAYSLFGELLIPASESVDITAALRRDHYSDFGDTTNPKIGLEWEIAKNLRFRGSYGTSFKAPNLFDLSGVPFTVPSTIVDPARGNESATVNLISGGNRNLRPEEARTHNFGLSYGFDLKTPGQRVDLSIDAWRVDQSARIVSPTGQVFVDNEDLFPERVTRTNPSEADISAGRPGAITTVNATSINFGRSLVEGVDLRARLRVETSSGSTFTINGEATHVSKYEAELIPGVIEDRKGNYSAEGFAPEWKAMLNAGYERGPWQASVTARYIDSYKFQTAMIDSSTIFDALISYEFDQSINGSAFSGMKLSIGSTNLFDSEPPFMNFLYGYDPLQYNNIGRFIYARISKKF